MKQDDFNNIMKRINALTTQCKEMRFDSIGELKSITLADVTKKVGQARTLLSTLDSLNQNELYHIIGMSDMSSNQMSSFIKKYKELLSYRSDVKLIAQLKLDALPKQLISESNYKCKILDVNLKQTFER